MRYSINHKDIFYFNNEKFKTKNYEVKKDKIFNHRMSLHVQVFTNSGGHEKEIFVKTKHPLNTSFSMNILKLLLFYSLPVSPSFSRFIWTSINEIAHLGFYSFPLLSFCHVANWRQFFLKTDKYPHYQFDLKFAINRKDISWTISHSFGDFNAKNTPSKYLINS